MDTAPGEEPSRFGNGSPHGEHGHPPALLVMHARAWDWDQLLPT